MSGWYNYSMRHGFEIVRDQGTLGMLEGLLEAASVFHRALLHRHVNSHGWAEAQFAHESCRYGGQHGRRGVFSDAYAHCDNDITAKPSDSGTSPEWLAHFPIAMTDYWSFWRPRFLYDFSRSSAEEFATAVAASSFVPGLMGFHRPWLRVTYFDGGDGNKEKDDGKENADGGAARASAGGAKREKRTTSAYDGYSGALRTTYPPNYCFVHFLRAALPAFALPAPDSDHESQSGARPSSWWRRLTSALSLCPRAHPRLLTAFEWDSSPQPFRERYFHAGPMPRSKTAKRWRDWWEERKNSRRDAGAAFREHERENARALVARIAAEAAATIAAKQVATTSVEARRRGQGESEDADDGSNEKMSLAAEEALDALARRNIEASMSSTVSWTVMGDVALELVTGIHDTLLLATVDLADTLYKAWPSGDVEWADNAFDRGRSDAEQHTVEIRSHVRAFLEQLESAD